MALFLLVVLIAVALGIVGVVLHGLFYLLIIGIVIFVVALLLGMFRMTRRRAAPPR